MSTHEGGLSPREHDELRDLVLAGTQRIRPAGAHRAQFIAAGVALLLVGAVTGGVVTATLRTDQQTTPVTTPAPSPTSSPSPEGWVAYSSGSGQGDIFVVAPGSPPNRILGSDGDGVDQICPAFSSDGARLASGQGAGEFGSGWRDPALVITELTAAGEASASKTIPLDGLVRPPCPIWSPDGRWIAFGAETHDAALWGVVDQVWMVGTETGEIRRLTGLAGTDIEWAADGSELYIPDEDGILVYSVNDDDTRVLDDTFGATALTASPDGRNLAVERARGGAGARADLWLMNVDGTNQRVLVDEYDLLHGIGPVWSADGRRVVFQRTCATFTDAAAQEQPCSDQQEVVVVTVSEGDPLGPVGTQTVISAAQTTEGDEPRLWFPRSVTWSPDSETLLYLAQEEIPSAAGNALLTVSVTGSAVPAIVWDTPAGIGAFTAFPRNDFQNWGAP